MQVGNQGRKKDFWSSPAAMGRFARARNLIAEQVFRPKPDQPDQLLRLC